MTSAWQAPNSSVDESWRFGILACGCWATRVGSRTVRLSFLARWSWRASFCGLAICSWPRLAPRPRRSVAHVARNNLGCRSLTVVPATFPKRIIGDCQHLDRDGCILGTGGLDRARREGQMGDVYP